MDRKAIVILILVVGGYFGYHYGVYMPKYRDWQVKQAAWKAEQARIEEEKKKNAPAEAPAVEDRKSVV